MGVECLALSSPLRVVGVVGVVGRELPAERDAAGLVVRGGDEDGAFGARSVLLHPLLDEVDGVVVGDGLACVAGPIVVVRTQVDLGALDHEHESVRVLLDSLSSSSALDA